jgi:hypothetical protein
MSAAPLGCTAFEPAPISETRAFGKRPGPARSGTKCQPWGLSRLAPRGRRGCGRLRGAAVSAGTLDAVGRVPPKVVRVEVDLGYAAVEADRFVRQ